MSGGHGYIAAARPPAGRARRLIAAALLAAASALAAIGASGAIVVYASPSGPGGAVLTQLRSGWGWAFMVAQGGDPDAALTQFMITWIFRADMMDVPPDRIAAAPLVGAPVTVFALLALVVAVRLLLADRRPPGTDPGAGLAALTGGLLAGGVASIVLDAAAEIGDARGPSSIWQSVQIGAGGRLIMAAAVAALVAGVLASWSPAVDVSREPPLHRRGAHLLPLVAALAIGGGFAPLLVGRGVHAGSPLTPAGDLGGAGKGFDVPLVAATETAPSLWVVLVAASVLMLVSWLVLVRQARRSTDSVRTRSLGIGSCALVVGVAAHVWVDLLAAMRNADVLVGFGRDVVAAPGAGAWLLLLGGVVALVPIASLLRPVRLPIVPTPGIDGYAAPLWSPPGSAPPVPPPTP